MLRTDRLTRFVQTMTANRLPLPGNRSSDRSIPTELTDILILVVRYFGGIELGTSGLIVAYRTAAAEAIAAAEIEERTVDEDITVAFEYPYLNGIMRIVKEDNPLIVSQKFEMDCEMTLRIRKGEAEKLKNRLLKVESAYLK